MHKQHTHTHTQVFSKGSPPHTILKDGKEDGQSFEKGQSLSCYYEKSWCSLLVFSLSAQPTFTYDIFRTLNANS